MGRKPKTVSDTASREDAILEAAIAVFGSKGYSAATTNEIAKTAGVAEGTIFRYFNTKKDLLSGILVKMVNTMGEKVVLSSLETIVKNSAGKELKEVLQAIIQDRMAFVRKMLPMGRILTTEAIYHPDLQQAFYNSIYTPATRLFSGFIEVLQEQGRVRKDIDRELVFGTIFSMFAGIVIQSNLFKANRSEDYFQQMMDAAIDILIRGIGIPDAEGAQHV